MYLAYSAFKTIIADTPAPSNLRHEQPENELLLRYRAYQTTCNKYSREIAAIQKYLPGWAPEFR